MKYILLIYHDEDSWNRLTEVERENIYAEYRQLIEELKSSGKFLFGNQLEATGQSVRVRDGQTLVTDGPFAETREQVGGFFMIEADSLNEANSIAARIPSARTGTIEVRPLAATAAASGPAN
jgi:hypothetical protein